MVNPVVRSSEPETVTILSGASVSNGINLGGRVLCGVYMPAAWTAAGLTFQTSLDNSTFYSAYSVSAEIVATVAAGLYVAIDPLLFRGAPYLRLRSGIVSLPVVQLADRSIVLMLADPRHV